MSHFFDPLRPLNVRRNLWMSPYDDDDDDDYGMMKLNIHPPRFDSSVKYCPHEIIPGIKLGKFRNVFFFIGNEIQDFCSDAVITRQIMRSYSTIDYVHSIYWGLTMFN